MSSRWSDLAGAVWVPSVLPSHFFAEILFHSGQVSARSALLEPRRPESYGLPRGLIFETPGFPSSLLIGEDIIEALDARFGGTIKEVAGVDDFGRPCVEALCYLNDVLARGTTFASPVFSTTREPAVALGTRRYA